MEKNLIQWMNPGIVGFLLTDLVIQSIDQRDLYKPKSPLENLAMDQYYFRTAELKVFRAITKEKCAH